MFAEKSRRGFVKYAFNMENLLFDQEFQRLQDDCLDGSVDEYRIFTEVFFEGDKGQTNKRRLFSEVSSFEADDVNYIDDPFFPNSVNSVLKRQEEPCSSVEHLRGKPLQGSEPEDFSLMMRSSPTSSCDMKLSTIDFSAEACLATSFNSVGSCRVDSTVSEPATHISRGCILESSSVGIEASYYLVKKCQIGQKLEPEVGNRDVFNSACPCLERNERKDIGTGQAISSPVSQERHPTKVLVVSTPTTAKIKLGPGPPAKPKWKDHCFVALDDAQLSMPKDMKNDPRPLLRYRVNRFLRLAGWVIGRRKRNSKSRLVGEYVYKSPGGRPFREFCRAWSLCRESLFTHSNNKLQKTEPTEWSDLTDFRSDLSRMASNLETLGNLETDASLAHMWCLLDPYVNVVFIKKTIRLLNQGKAVKAKRNVVIHPYGKCDAACCSDSLPDMFAYHCDKGYTGPLKTINGTATKSRSVSGNERISLCQNSFQICGPGRTYDQNDSCSFEVPVKLDGQISRGGSITVGSFEDSNKSSLTCGEKGYVKDDELPLGDHKDLCVVHLKQEDEPFDLKKVPVELQLGYVKSKDKGYSFTPNYVSFAGNAPIRRKANKKSRDLSEIKVERLYDNGNLSPSSCEIGRQAMDRNGFNLGSSASMGMICEQNRSKKPKRGHLKDDDLLISAFVRIKPMKSTKRSVIKSEPMRKTKSHKGSCKLRPRSLKRGGKHFVEGKWSINGQRTVLSWLIHSGIVSIGDVVEYHDPKNDLVVKDGLVTYDGILCKCCEKTLSISEFKNHAGFKLNGPCSNLFMESGKPFSLCQLEAWSAEYKAKKGTPRTILVEEIDENDDSCGRCGDGGELICCDSCPSTFHQACLYAQNLPEGDWYCPQCTCQNCGEAVDRKQAPKPYGILTCRLCENSYHLECVEEESVESEVASDTWFCDKSCQEVYLGLLSQIGTRNLLSDGLCWTLLKCIHGDQKVHSSQRFVTLKAECNAKLAVSLTLMEECFLPMVDPRTGIDMIPHVVYNWGSQFARLNYQGFYTVILEKNDILISVASIRIHGVTVAELPLIATCSKYRRQGMCRRLMDSIELMLKSLKVKMLVISAIPDLVETWTKGFGFTPLEDNEKRSLSKINLMVFPGSVWLKKHLCNSHKITEQEPESDNPTAGVSSQGTASAEPEQQSDQCVSFLDAQMEVVSKLSDSEKTDTDEDLGGSSLQNQYLRSPVSSESIQCRHPIDQHWSCEGSDPEQEKREPLNQFVEGSCQGKEEGHTECEISDLPGDNF